MQAIEFWSTIAEEEFELLLVGEGEEEDKEVGIMGKGFPFFCFFNPLFFPSSA